MTGGRFTERARTIINYANEEAIRLNHDQIDTEHLLLGLVREGQGLAARALQDLNVSLEKLGAETKEMIKKPGSFSSDRGPIDFSRAAKQVLQYAMEEARKSEYDCVGTEHILLGLIREENGIAAKSLANFGVTLEKVRKVLEPVISHPARRRTKKMPYIASAERIGMEKGLQQGSLQEGKEMVLEALNERFGEISPEISQAISQIEDKYKLRSLLRCAIRCESLEEFKQELDK